MWSLCTFHAKVQRLIATEDLLLCIIHDDGCAMSSWAWFRAKHDEFASFYTALSDELINLLDGSCAAVDD